MDLSIIIVNYKVKHFLDQCLHSVFAALKNCCSEVFVVDNHSLDGSVEMLREKYPQVKLIKNETNLGFSKANNQAIKKATGKYILLLNPDTVVEEATFEKLVSFMNRTPDAGAVGVKMIDGRGVYLPESKRGLPSPWTAFYKVFGLSKLFPRSKKFGQYNLTYTDVNKIQEVDVLAGAFMLLRKKALDKIGELDESFFMYGEDIDLSYRLQLGGFKNYYYPETTIIHYKGESTKKGSLNYVMMFYKAMLIFSKKHFPAEKIGFFIFFIHLAIIFRALISSAKRILAKFLQVLIDAFLIGAGFHLLSPLWAQVHFGTADYYPREYYTIAIPIYVALFLMGILFSGGYKKSPRLFFVARGILCAFLFILLAYSLLDENYRYSRALLVLGASFSFFILLAYRQFFHWLKLPGFELQTQATKNMAIIGGINECQRIKNSLGKLADENSVIGFISIHEQENTSAFLGKLNNVASIVEANSINELIFCAQDIGSAQIIACMHQLQSENLSFKIAPPKSLSLVGSNSKQTSGDLYLLTINQQENDKIQNKKALFNLQKLRNRLKNKML